MLGETREDCRWWRKRGERRAKKLDKTRLINTKLSPDPLHNREIDWVPAKYTIFSTASNFY